MITPERYIGNVLQLCQERRGIQVGLQYLDPTRSMLIMKSRLMKFFCVRLL